MLSTLHILKNSNLPLAKYFKSTAKLLRSEAEHFKSTEKFVYTEGRLFDSHAFFLSFLSDIPNGPLYPVACYTRWPIIPDGLI